MPSEATNLLLQDTSFSYTGGFTLHHINLFVPNGQMTGLLGPNGSGKTTLLKLATGVFPPVEGDISVGGVSLRKLSRREIAQRIAVVPQQFDIPFAYTVEEVVLLGRTPFVHDLIDVDKKGRQVVLMVLEATGLIAFRNRYFNELSGGERQKVVMAMALAQEPQLLLLDEPTAHLDISHQIEILELLRKLNRDQKMTIVAAMHDLNLAALYFDRLVLLDHGAIFADGPPDTVITKETIQKVFSASIEVSRHPKALVPQIVILPPDLQSK
jgi:iron complex transport system ATP-binding protein